jgi:hypothetical protein
MEGKESFLLKRKFQGQAWWFIIPAIQEAEIGSIVF